MSTESTIEPNPAIPQTDWKAECLRLLEKIVIDHRAIVHLVNSGAITPQQWADAKERATIHPAPESQESRTNPPEA